MMSALLALALLAATLGVAGCGGGDEEGTATQGPARFGKTRIAVNLGLAAGATKRYIVDPAQEGGFAKGAPKRKRTIAKAIVAGAFAAKQLNDAKKLAERDPDIQPLVANITGLTGVLGGVTAALQGGNVDVTELVGAGSEVDQLLEAGKALGLDVTERTPPGL